jgi:hypothetical protein
VLIQDFLLLPQLLFLLLVATCCLLPLHHLVTITFTSDEELVLVLVLVAATAMIIDYDIFLYSCCRHSYDYDSCWWGRIAKWSFKV